MAALVKRALRKLPARKLAKRASLGSGERVGGALAGEIWSAMVHAVLARRDHMAATAARFELTLPQAHLLRLLKLGPARTMTSLAGALACDASNITGIVDRLESRGLIARASPPHDRRIKHITLTTRGRGVLKALTSGFLEPPEALQRLEGTELRRLHGIIVRVFGAQPFEPWCPNASIAPAVAK